MLATPLLAALSQAYPQARFDWAVSDWARPAVAGNARLTELIATGPGSLHDLSWGEVRALAGRLRQEQYDTCFIPSRSSLLALVAWWAGIPQRVGLNVGGRGFAHTVAVVPPGMARHESAVYLALAGAAGVDPEVVAAVGMEFHAPDGDRSAVTRRLVDELDWLGDAPLVVVHPGGGQNPLQTDLSKQWPVERFALLANHLVRQHQAQVLLVGGEADRPLAQAVAGMTSGPVVDWTGHTPLGELGALCEVADLYVGNDTGPTHVAAAVGCPTLAIFGPSDPAVSAPYATRGQVVALWHELEEDGSFSWQDGVTVAEAVKAADGLLARAREEAGSGL
jgi:lipopolysaccharide heptosyltransferase II